MSHHLTASELVALRDGEEAGLDAGRTAHLEACPRCREALEAARARARRIEGALPTGATPTPEAMERARAAVRARLGGAAGHGHDRAAGSRAGVAGGTGRRERADVPAAPSPDTGRGPGPTRREGPGRRSRPEGRRADDDPSREVGLAVGGSPVGPWSLARAAGLLLLLAGGAAALPGSPEIGRAHV